MKLFLVIVLALLGFPESHASAEEAPLPPGLRVRVSTLARQALSEALPETSPGRNLWETQFEGTLLRHSRTSVTLQSAAGHDPVEIPLSLVRTLEVSHGERSLTGNGAFLGLITGAAGGVLTGVFLCQGNNCGAGTDLNLTGAVVGGLGLGGALAGAGIGALLGSMFYVDDWNEVPLSDLRVEVWPTPSRGLRVALSVPLSSSP